MEKMYQQFKDVAEFYIVYIREAHAADNRNLKTKNSELDAEIIRLTADAESKERENNELRGQISGLNDSFQGLTAQLNAASARRSLSSSSVPLTCSSSPCFNSAGILVWSSGR